MFRQPGAWALLAYAAYRRGLDDHALTDPSESRAEGLTLVMSAGLSAVGGVATSTAGWLRGWSQCGAGASAAGPCAAGPTAFSVDSRDEGALRHFPFPLEGRGISGFCWDPFGIWAGLCWQGMVRVV